MIGVGPGAPPAGGIAASAPSRANPFISATDPADPIRGGAFQIQGTAFTQEGRTVTGATVDGENATPAGATNTTIEGVCPTFGSYPNTGDVAVTFSDGTSAAFPADVVLPPIDTAVMDPVAPVSLEAFEVTLTGAGFTAAGFAPESVTIAGVVRAIDSHTATQIVATFPAGIATSGVKAVSVQFEAGPDADAPDVTIAPAWLVDYATGFEDPPFTAAATIDSLDGWTVNTPALVKAVTTAPNMDGSQWVHQTGARASRSIGSHVGVPIRYKLSVIPIDPFPAFGYLDISLGLGVFLGTFELLDDGNLYVYDGTHPGGFVIGTWTEDVRIDMVLTVNAARTSWTITVNSVDVYTGAPNAVEPDKIVFEAAALMAIQVDSAAFEYFA